MTSENWEDHFITQKGIRLKNTKIIWVDSIRVVACFMVVFLHTAAPLLNKYHDISLTYWFWGNIYDSTVRVCVHLFFMISGFLLLQKDEPLTSYFSKRFSKLFIPIVFWSLFFVLWRNLFVHDNHLTFQHFYSLVLKPSYYHLWFLYALIGLYLFVPILRKVTTSADNTLLIYYSVIWFIAVSLIPLAEKVSGIDSRIDLYSISGYVGYLVLGLILGRKEISTKVFVISVAIFLISIVITFLGTYILTLRNEGIFVGYLYGYLAPNTIVAACACFIVIKYLASNTKTLQITAVQKLTATLSSCSFGIYLLHPVFLYLLKNGTLGIKLSAWTGNPLWYVPITSICVFVLSFLLIFIIRKIPIFRLISP